jgi:hypothetical protein
MQSKVAEERLEEVMTDGDAVMALRDIGRPWTDRRIVRVAIMEPLPATHTLPVLIVSKTQVCAAAALLNSMTLDFLTRIHMPGGHLTTPVLTQCATPSPAEIPRKAAELAAKLSLTCTHVARAVGLPLHRWNPSEREALDAECDALVAQAYGLTTADYETVLNHFKLLERIETRQPPGEYRSKRLRLEAFEEIGGGR